MLALSLLAAGGAGFLLTKQMRNPAIGASGAAVLLLIGAVIMFLSRPAFSEIDDRVAVALKEDSGSSSVVEQATASASGKYQCTLNLERSRITVSQDNELPFEWTDGGCVNGRTQYGRDGAKWSRIFVPNEEQTVTISSFRPDLGEFTEERYLLGLNAMTKARTIRQKYGNKACTDDSRILSDIENMVKAIRAEMPSQANERLIYECKKPE